MTQNINLQELTLDEINAVLIGLQELPAKICNPLTEKIRTQAMQQLEQAQSASGQVINKNIDENIATVDKVGA